MIRKEKYPILEFDDNKDAIINPNLLQKKYGILPTNKLIITFFKEAINMLLEDGKIEQFLTISGENDLILYKFVDDDVLLMHGMIGCPACAGYMDELIGIGISKVIFCGGGGVLDKNIKVGELLVVEGAIRDEGFSYHYVEPSRIIYSQEDVRKVICSYLKDNNIPYIEGIVWTTDAFYRETKDKVLLRKEEGAKIVEMEQSGCIAVAQFRNIKYGAIIYGGDDVSQDVWNDRSWKSRKSIRYSLIEMCKEIVNLI